MNNTKPKAKSAPQRHWFDRWCLKLFGTTIDFGDFHKLAENNYKLGLVHLERGNLKDAILRFRMVGWFEPGHAPAWYQLGRAYLLNNRTSAAVAAFRKALRINPKNEEAGYMLAVALGGNAIPADLPKKIPVSLAIPHFDRMAAAYTGEQIDIYKYSGHVLLGNAVKEAVSKGRVDHVILDLGVGTGLCGPELRPISAQLVGVDFSTRMLGEAMKLEDAAGKKIYDALVRREIHEYLRESAAQAYDVIAAANTLNYIGELRPLFVQVAQALKEGGLFAFTADIQKDGLDFAFKPLEGRFHFGKSYLTMTANLAGLKPVKLEEASVYPNEKMWLGIFRR